jgi:hypothetical protein
VRRGKREYDAENDADTDDECGGVNFLWLGVTAGTARTPTTCAANGLDSCEYDAHNDAGGDDALCDALDSCAFDARDDADATAALYPAILLSMAAFASVPGPRVLAMEWPYWPLLNVCVAAMVTS